MRKIKKLLSIMTLGIFLVVNTVTVSAAEITLPTPPVTATQIYLYEITSEKAGQEIIDGQMGASRDHGGTWLQVTFVEIGTRESTLQATFNNKDLVMTDIEEIDINGDSIIDRRISRWRYEGTEFESGWIAIRISDSTPPWRTISYSYLIH